MFRDASEDLLALTRSLTVGTSPVAMSRFVASASPSASGEAATRKGAALLAFRCRAQERWLWSHDLDYRLMANRRVFR